MNVVFWGEERGSGTTAHMFAVAGMLAAMCPEMKIAIGASVEKERAAIRFYDCGTGLTGRKRRMLKHADLVVVSLRQESACMERFFQWDFHISGNILFLLGGYAGEREAGRAHLERLYRVEPERIGEIPFNNEFYLALLQGKSSSFIRREYRKSGNGTNELFIRELKKAAVCILRRAEEVRLPDHGDGVPETGSGRKGRNAGASKKQTKSKQTSK